MLEALVARYGWPELGERIPIRCFTTDPSLESSLKFLRKTDWARAKVEHLYVDHMRRVERNRRRKYRRAAKLEYQAKQDAEAESRAEVEDPPVIE